MKVALVYDRVNKWGGAERILLALHAIFPDAPLYTSVYDPKGAQWASVFSVRPSFLQRIPLAKFFHEFFAPFMPLAFESFNFDQYDLVISVSSEASKGIITKPTTKHISIILTPTRYLWSGYAHYFKNSIFRFFSMPLIWYLRKWDVQASQRADGVVAISKTVQKRIKKYYNRTAHIIYPPLMITEKSMAVTKSQNYYLTVSRLSHLTTYKRIDLLIDVANMLHIPLKIVGEGNAKNYLKARAGNTVEFLGRLTDKRLAYYYKNCKALLFAAEEDFGYVMVEANYFGRPVIAYKAGGAVEIIKEGLTGDFFEQQSIESITKALEKFDERRYNSKISQQNAKRFSFNRFQTELRSYLQQFV